MNAVKFTSKGFIELKVEIIQTRNNPHRYVRFEVKDSGIGIEETRHTNIFNLFEKD